MYLNISNKIHVNIVDMSYVNNHLFFQFLQNNLDNFVHHLIETIDNLDLLFVDNI